MTLVRNKIRFVYFILLQASPEDRRKLEAEMVLVVVVNNLEAPVLAWFKLGFPMFIFKKYWRMTIYLRDPREDGVEDSKLSRKKYPSPFTAAVFMLLILS